MGVLGHSWSFLSLTWLILWMNGVCLDHKLPVLQSNGPKIMLTRTGMNGLVMMAINRKASSCSSCHYEYWLGSESSWCSFEILNSCTPCKTDWWLQVTWGCESFAGFVLIERWQESLWTLLLGYSVLCFEKNFNWRFYDVEDCSNIFSSFVAQFTEAIYSKWIHDLLFLMHPMFLFCCCYKLLKLRYHPTNNQDFDKYQSKAGFSFFGEISSWYFLGPVGIPTLGVVQNSETRGWGLEVTDIFPGEFLEQAWWHWELE